MHSRSDPTCKPQCNPSKIYERTDLRIADIFEVPGKNVAFHVSCEQPVPVDGNAPNLLLMVEASEAFASPQVPQLSSNTFENIKDVSLPLQTCPKSQR